MDNFSQFWLFQNDKFSEDFLRLTNLDANFKPGQIQTAFLVAMTNLGYLKMSLNEVWTNLEALNLSFYSLDKFRCSRFVLFKKRQIQRP